ncbi:hypothetical protein ACFV42_46580 [Streptomyces solisilvae]|uniref:hypothetical protein n=1 Tax=Streptomyces malaysiensis TaxID=92644 RepID=UPI0036B53970
MPHTAASIREKSITFQAQGWWEVMEAEGWTEEIRRETAELNAVLARIEAGEGEPEVWVHCSSDTGTGWTKKAVITAGVRLDDVHYPAHDPVVYESRSRDGRLKAHEWIRRQIWHKDPAKSRLVIDADVTLRWETDPRC